VVTDCPFGWGRTRQSKSVLENVVSQLTGVALCGIQPVLVSGLTPSSKRTACQGGLFRFKVLCGRYLLSPRIADHVHTAVIWGDSQRPFSGHAQEKWLGRVAPSVVAAVAIGASYLIRRAKQTETIR
jgi:hypothetical protein